MPPLMAVALNTTAVPSQMIVADAAMLTDTGAGTITVMAIELDVAVPGVAQAAFEFMRTLTTSPLFNAFVVKDGELVPAFTPFIFH